MIKRSTHFNLKSALSGFVRLLPMTACMIVFVAPSFAQDGPNVGPLRVSRDAPPGQSSNSGSGYQSPPYQPSGNYAPNGAPVGPGYQNGMSNYMRAYPANNNNMHGTRDRPPSGSSSNFGGGGGGGFLGKILGGGGGGGGGYNGGNPPSVGVSDSTTQMRRWEDEFRRDHPGEPMPNMGQLQHMHMNEINAQITRGGQQMWANRQAELSKNHQMAHDMQAQRNAANHQNWTAQQWRNWEGDYEASGKAQADAYKEGVRISGQMAREEAWREHNFGQAPVPGSIK